MKQKLLLVSLVGTWVACSGPAKLEPAARIEDAGVSKPEEPAPGMAAVDAGGEDARPDRVTSAAGSGGASGMTASVSNTQPDAGSSSAGGPSAGAGGGGGGTSAMAPGGVVVAGPAADPVACKTDNDCSTSTIESTLWRPLCDQTTHTCGPCKTQAEEDQMAVRVIACLSLLQLQPCAPGVSDAECLIVSCHRSCEAAAAIAPASNAAAAAGSGAVPTPNTAWLGGGKPVPCAADADCRKALYTPVCNAGTGLCDVCPDPDQEKALALRVDACIILASPRCLNDEDCRFGGCVTTCDAP